MFFFLLFLPLASNLPIGLCNPSFDFCINIWASVHRAPELTDAIISKVNPRGSNSVDLNVNRKSPDEIITTMNRRDQLWKLLRGKLECLQTIIYNERHLLLQPEQNSEKTNKYDDSRLCHCVQCNSDQLETICGEIWLHKLESWLSFGIQCWKKNSFS